MNCWNEIRLSPLSQMTVSVKCCESFNSSIETPSFNGYLQVSEVQVNNSPSIICCYSHTKITKQSTTITLYGVLAFFFAILAVPFRAIGRVFARRNLVTECDLDVEWEDTAVSPVMPAMTPLPPPPASPSRSFDPRKTLIGLGAPLQGQNLSGRIAR